MKEAEPMSEFQSTRPHGARQYFLDEYVWIEDVSIHAPAWGATREFVCVLFDDGVSIHAPAWGATREFVCVLFDDGVSIHAPAWGATACVPRNFEHRCGFNPRARMGRDTSFGATKKRSRCFNPRARMGRDGPNSISEKARCEFQSTRPHGARPFLSYIIYSLLRFQSTRPHGARRQAHPADFP